MLSLLATSVLSLLPQEPAALPVAPVAPAPAIKVTPESWLPANSLFALTITAPEGDPDVTALLQSDEWQELETLCTGLLRSSLNDGLPSWITQSLADAFHNGIALGVVGVDGNGIPDFVLVADLGGRQESLAKEIQKLSRADNGLYTFPVGSMNLLLDYKGRMLTVGTRGATVRAAAERASGLATRSLADDAEFNLSKPNRSIYEIAHIFVRPSRYADLIQELAPDGQSDAAKRVMSILGLSDMTWGSASLQSIGNELVAQFQLASPKGFSLLDALAGTTGKIDVSLARFVPPTATSYGFYAISFGNVYDETTAAIAAINPEFGTMLDNGTDSLRQRTGFDLRADLIGNLSERLLTFTITDTEQQLADFGVMIELRDGAKFEQALEKLAPLAPIPLTLGSIAGATCWRGPTDEATGTAPAIVVVDNWLAFAGSDAALGEIVRHAQAPKARPEVLTFLRTLPENSVWARAARSSTIPDSCSPTSEPNSPRQECVALFCSAPTMCSPSKNACQPRRCCVPARS